MFIPELLLFGETIASKKILTGRMALDHVSKNLPHTYKLFPVGPRKSH